MLKIYRAWINQPSTLQPLHLLHGEYCIAVDDSDFGHVTLYFTEGNTHSCVAPRGCISKVHLSSATQGVSHANT